MSAPGPQLPLPLAHRAAQGREDFLVSDSNAVAVTWIDRWPDWPQPVAVLVGPAGSGKSHLADVWRSKARALPCEAQALRKEDVPELLATKALVVENLHQLRDPEALFHLLNFARETGSFLLLTSAESPAALRFPLPDLMSRLNAAPTVQLHAPDEMLLLQLIAKHFADRGVHATPTMLEYICNRIDRSAHAARDVVQRIDMHALSHGKRLNMSVIRDVLNAPADAG